MSIPHTYPEWFPCWVDTKQTRRYAASHFSTSNVYYGPPCSLDVPGCRARRRSRHVSSHRVPSSTVPWLAAIGTPPGDVTVEWNPTSRVNDGELLRRPPVAGGPVAASRGPPAKPVETRGGRADGGGLFSIQRGARFPSACGKPRRRPGVPNLQLSPASGTSAICTTGVRPPATVLCTALRWVVSTRSDSRHDPAARPTVTTSPPTVRTLESTNGRNLSSAPPGFADGHRLAWPAGKGHESCRHLSYHRRITRRVGGAGAERLGGRWIFVGRHTEWTRPALIRDPQGPRAHADLHAAGG